MFFFNYNLIIAEIWAGKKYTNYQSENFDEYMKALGVGFFTRVAGNTVTPTVELIKNSGNTYTLKTTSTFRNSEITFELGKEFDEVTLDGRNVKSKMTLEGNVLTQQQGGDPPSTIIREFGDKEMTTTLKVKDITSVRKYRVEE